MRHRDDTYLAERDRDEGSALIFALIFITLASMIILPMLNYSRSVMRAAETQDVKGKRAAATTGSLRVMLADPAALYAVCKNSGLHTAVKLATMTDLGTKVNTECTTVSEANELKDSDLRVAMTTVAVGTTTAPGGTTGGLYAKAGDANPGTWWADSSTTSTGGKIFTPYLPTHALSHPASSGYMMPSWAGNCRVFFPGTYVDPVTISDTVPTFFTSGVYYFENTVTFGAGAKVVVGEGAIDGCTTNAEAAYYAVNAPTTVSISGIGATFVFGGSGRMVLTDGGTTSGPSVKFNSRLVGPTDVGNTVSAGVSIVSVNGLAVTATSSSDLAVAGYLSVKRSLTEANPTDAVAPVDAASTGYKPSTLVPAAPPAAEVTAIIDITLTGTGATTLYVPGYVAVPQGRINISVSDGKAANKSVQMVGAVLAAKITESATIPADLQLGLVNRVVQKTFKLVSSTDASLGKPVVVATALVQVNDYGEYAINSWVVSDS